MKTIDEIAEEFDSHRIDEALLDPKKIIFTPVQLTKGNIEYGICVGKVFTIKNQKYCEQLENSLKINFGIEVPTGIKRALSIVKQPFTKLIYLLYNQNKLMICNSNICKPLDGSKLQ